MNSSHHNQLIPSHPWVYCNGAFTRAPQATLAHNDRGFLLGDGVFETLRSVQGHLPLFRYHWHRLQRSAKVLEIPLPLNQQETLQMMLQLLNKNSIHDAGLRLSLSRGPGARGMLPTGIAQPTLLCTSFALPRPPAQGYRLQLATTRRNPSSPLSQLKSLNYLENILVRRAATRTGYDDAILLNTRDHLAETSCANIFFIKDQTLFTPPLADGVLPGVSRQHLLNLCQQQTISYHQCSLTLTDVAHAEAAFVSNALIYLHPIDRIDTPIQSYHFGHHPLFDRLYALYLHSVTNQNTESF